MKSIPVLACLLALQGLVAALGSASAPAGAAPAAPDTLGVVAADTLGVAAVTPSPLAVLAAFERAWLAGAGDSVLTCMSTRSIELALHRAGPPGGHFPPNQAAYLIKDLLRYCGTEEFRVVRFTWKDDSPPAAEITWVHRVSGYATKETLEVELALEDGAWRVVRVAAR
jgi:hypothetical protein